MATVLACLRGNVTLPGDRALSDRELSALLPDRRLARLPLAEAWLRFTADAGAAASGEVAEDGLLAMLLATAGEAYLVRLDVHELDLLLRRATFVQQLLAVPSRAGADEAAALAALARSRPQLSRWEAPRLAALGDQCAVELAALAGVTAERTEQVPAAVAALFATLLGGPASARQRAHAGSLARRPRAGGYLTHDLHIYKAKFFPRLARAALNLLLPPGAAPGGLLLDPFAGSGTALLEAARLGHPALGLDLDPLSVLISRGKLLLGEADAPAALASTPDAVAPSAPHSLSRLFPSRSPGSHEKNQGMAATPAPFVLPPWLARKLTPAASAELVAEVETLRREIAALAGGVERTAARLALSDALTRKLRMRFLGTGVGRFALEPARPSVTALYRRRREAIARAATLNARVLAGAGLALRAPAAALIGDARALPLADGAVSAVLTSPPYLPASSGRENYLRSKAPSLLALGLLDAAGLETLDRRATGSMHAAAGDGGIPLLPGEARLIAWLAADPLRAIKAEPSRRYFADLRRALDEMRRVLQPGGRAAVVVGT
ncbi:MAG TPA: hypothetical protein VFD32_21045, partial [Dehalococcoidia bacterium]|nr:hypothetical protein [Dehalococcoidia bacterium]